VACRRALAATWRRVARRALHGDLELAVRFLHYALFDGKFLSLHYYLVDYAVLLGSACWASGCSA